MASSRLEKIGTIFTRVTGLIRAGAMKMEDRPMWYDIYKKFPPTLPPKYDRPAPKTKIQAIFYKEDLIRAEFHKKVGRSLPMVNLKDNKMPTLCQKMIHLCNKIQSEKQISLDDAINEAYDMLKVEGVKKTSEAANQSLVSTFKEAIEKHPAPTLNVNVKNIFKEN